MKPKSRLKKEETVRELYQLLSSHKTFAITEYRGLTSNQLKRIRKNLEGRAKIKIAKNTLMRLAIKKTFNGLDEKISNYLFGQCAYVFSNLSPLKLFRMLEENRIESEAKPGETVEEDVVIPEGSTDLPAGEMITLLSKYGIKTKVIRGKIEIAEEKVILRKGEKVTDELSKILSRLEIKPIRRGLNLIAAVNGEGVIYDKKILSVDPVNLKETIRNVSLKALTLSIKTSYYTPAAMEYLVGLSWGKAYEVAQATSYYTAKTMQNLLLRAVAIGLTLEKTLKLYS